MISASMALCKHVVASYANTCVAMRWMTLCRELSAMDWTDFWRMNTTVYVYCDIRWNVTQQTVRLIMMFTEIQVVALAKRYVSGEGSL